MMSPRRWILLLIFYISYLMFGASIYYHIEHNLEKEGRATQLQERIEINEYLVDQLSNKNESDRNIVLEKITDYCGKPVTNYTTDLYEDPYKWTFYHSFFFMFTVLSTVGYGNLAPTTTLGRMIMIAYSLLGIPINGILFTGLGEYFSKTFTSIYRRYKKYKMSNNIRYVPPQLGLFATVCIALVPGITFFIVLPSLIFSYFEKWSFATSVYYSYVTMTTIGFGDFVPTFQPQQPREFGALFVVYQIFIIVWFIFSLGYLVMIMTFISKGLRSKRLSRLEYQLTENIKATQGRIWNGVTKDVGYLRRILNELYIMKFKPVYNEPLSFTEKRSISCPDLTMYRVDPPVIERKRAFSECYGDARAVATPPIRTSSDTELTNINKQKTFESAENFKQTTDLLAQVVTALASIRPAEEELTIASSGMHGGYHGFTDSQILASEWSFPGSGVDAIPQRNRAFSDFNLNPKTSLRPTANEWTWSGDNNQIQQAINIRCRNRQARDDYYRSSFPPPMEGVVVDIDRDEAGTSRQRRKFSMPDGGKQFFKKLIPFKKRSSQGLIDKNDFMSRKFSITSVPEVPDRINPAQDHYKTINVGHSDVKNSISVSSSINNIFANGGPAGSSTTNRRSGPYEMDPQQESYQRTAPLAVGGLRKRRESLFTQNPNMRRSSMFPGSSSNYRRGSLFTDPAARPPPARGGATSRRQSLFSVMDETTPNQEILENTTIADLIRALEVMHTQAVLHQPPDDSATDKKKRKMGNAGLAAPALPPIFSIFNPDDQASTSGNRLFSRRSTIVGPASNQSTTSNILTRRRPSGVPMEFNEPPPSYSEKEEPKFKRRFSVRPTSLQTPPGMAPPPSQSSSGGGQNVAQTALQRRLSLRPSPLAAIEGAALPTSRSGPSGASRTPSIQPSSSSTHSPLSRIVQISQAQRKNSEQKDPK